MEGKVVTPPRARSVVCHARLLWGYFYSERTGILQGRENRHSGIERPVMRWKHSEGVCSRVLEDVITDSPGCIPEYDLSNQVWYPVIPDLRTRYVLRDYPASGHTRILSKQPGSVTGCPGGYTLPNTTLISVFLLASLLSMAPWQ